MDKEALTNKLGEYFKGRKDVAFAYLFGSTAKDRTHSESDIDIGIYLFPDSKDLEYESENIYPNEDQIWGDVERLSGKQTDLVVLNRAPSTLFFSIMHEGIPIYIRDEALRSRMYLAVSMAAEDYRDFVDDYYTIMQRSHSISSIDREKLQRMISFMESECSDFERFSKISQSEYQNERDTRRLIERWAENIVNSSIDIAKTILASEKRPIPQTYKEIIKSLSTLSGFDGSIAEKLSIFSQTRNLLAHEYLDLRFARIKRFIQESQPLYVYLMTYIKGRLNE